MAHARLTGLPLDPPSRIKALHDIATELKTKGVGALTDSEVELVHDLKADIDRTDARLKTASDLAKMLPQPSAEPDWANAQRAGGVGDPIGRITAPASSSTHEPRAKAAEGFTKAMRGAFDAMGAGLRTKSGILPSAGTSVAFDYAAPLINSPRGPLTVSDLVAHTPTTSPSGTLLVQDQRVNNAAAVAIGQPKPLSSYTLTPRAWRVATIAHTVNVARQYLLDYAGLDTFIGAEMSFGLALALDTAILLGTTDEEGGTLPGILTTSGIGSTAFQSDVLKTIRVSIGDLENAGVEPTAIVLNPNDWTTIELARDNTSRYLLENAPSARPPRTLWDLPVVTSTTMTAGKALIGDFRNAVVMDREAVNIVAFESGLLSETAPIQDLATRNMLKLRGELRAAPLVQLPAAFKVATLA